jgi:hypothetical protein
MIKKFCPHCRTYSSSASRESPWNCATCNRDLSQEPILQLDEKAVPDVEDPEQPAEPRPEKKEFEGV